MFFFWWFILCRLRTDQNHCFIELLLYNFLVKSRKGVGIERFYGKHSGALQFTGCSTMVGDTLCAAVLGAYTHRHAVGYPCSQGKRNQPYIGYMVDSSAFRSAVGTWTYWVVGGAVVGANSHLHARHKTAAQDKHNEPATNAWRQLDDNRAGRRWDSSPAPRPLLFTLLCNMLQLQLQNEYCNP